MKSLHLDIELVGLVVEVGFQVRSVEGDLGE